MKRLFLIFTYCMIHAACCLSAQPQADGYPLANFGLTVNASADGAMFGKVLQNTGTLGKWLTNRGAVQISIEKHGTTHSLAGFEEKSIERKFPFVRGTYTKSPLIRTDMKTLAFCPLAVNDAETSALPVVMLEISLKNTGNEAEAFMIMIDNERPAGADFGLSVNSEVIAEDSKFSIPVKMLPDEEKSLHLAIAFYDSKWTSAKQFSTAPEIAVHARDHWNELLTGTQDFENHIPPSGDDELDEYLRWYMIPAVSLTRITRSGEALTMGYAELNQRDSYWTSWLHLSLYPQLEKKMIEESIEHQQPSGKIPTCILPLIERKDDLDINAFFILRAWRYFNYYKDSDALTAWWQPLKKAMDWLISRDLRGDGLPAQESMWGDWKDVRGIAGRLYSPFASMTYLAALHRMAEMAGTVGDAQAAEHYQLAYEKGQAFMNRPTQDGGLWNGRFYCQIQKDGTVSDRLLQDQMIGVFYGVVPDDRAQKIAESLNSQSLTPWGIAETTPYYPAEWGYAPGTYHNGGVWPWLSFMDCWARLKAGRRDEAIALIKRVAKADLKDSGDWSPNEHINSLTGKNLGFNIQGWNAALFGLVFELNLMNSARRTPS